jgi:Uma2 family endonuclease
VDSESVSVEHFSKLDRGEWLLREYTSLSDTIDLRAIDLSLSLCDIYDGVEFDTKAG